MRKFLSLLMVFSLIGVQTAGAYGNKGHRVVAEIADRHLNEAARKKIQEILGDQSLAEVAVWADEMKSNPDEYWRAANVFHYINISPGGTFEGSVRNPKGDMLSAYEEFEATLKSKTSSRAEKEHALKFLVHIVGDMHQPMHFGHRKDQGGNRTKVMWFDEITNLHAVWDSNLVEQENLSFTEMANFLDKASPEEIIEYQKAKPIDWVHEGLVLRDMAYDIGDRSFSWNYIYKNRPVIREQLRKGGVRLAGVLNEIFAE